MLLLLLGITVTFAVFLPVNPWPVDGWFESQYRLVGHFPGADNYTPIAAPAVFFKLTHEIAALLGFGLEGEMYVASIAQNLLVFIAAWLVYRSCAYLSSIRVASTLSVAFLIYVLAAGLAQSFWSESVVLALLSGVLFLNLRLYFEPTSSSRRFWWTAALASVLLGLAVITRVIPVLIIPAAVLLLDGRLNRRRLIGYAALASIVTVTVVVAMMAGNFVRFGRAEITNSSGRHLWEGVRDMVDDSLASSAQFAELTRANGKLQGLNHWQVKVPQARDAIERDRILGGLAKEAIRKQPVRFIKLGLVGFSDTIGQPVYRLGFGARSTHPDPLHRDEMLPPLAAKVSGVVSNIAGRVIARFYWLGTWLYPVVIFLTMSTGLAQAWQVRTRRAWIAPLVIGIALLAIIRFDTVAARTTFERYLPLALCVLLLAWQVIAAMRGAPRRVFDTPRVYLFAALVFFGSLWCGWQIEDDNTRNLVPYLPFLLAMAAMAIDGRRQRP